MQSTIEHPLDVVHMACWFLFTHHHRLILLRHLWSLDILLLLDHGRYLDCLLLAGIQLSWYLLGFLSVYFILEFFKEFILFCLVLILSQLAHDIIGLGHLLLQLPLVQQNISHFVIDISRLFQKIISLAHCAGHIDIYGSNFEIVFLLLYDCPPGAEKLSNCQCTFISFWTVFNWATTFFASFFFPCVISSLARASSCRLWASFFLIWSSNLLSWALRPCTLC